jgi:hypothetical protein
MINSILKNRKTRFFTLTLAFASVISLGILMQSCSKDDFENILYAEYLDIDMNKTTAFTTAELELIGMAVQRICKHSVFNGEKYEMLDKKTFSQINVSERLYNNLYQGKRNVAYVKSPRIKLKAEPIYTQGFGWMCSSYSLSHAETN